jgi:hypothetical protein
MPYSSGGSNRPFFGYGEGPDFDPKTHKRWGPEHYPYDPKTNPKGYKGNDNPNTDKSGPHIPDAAEWKTYFLNLRPTSWLDPLFELGSDPIPECRNDPRSLNPCPPSKCGLLHPSACTGMDGLEKYMYYILDIGIIVIILIAGSYVSQIGGIFGKISNALKSVFLEFEDIYKVALTVGIAIAGPTSKLMTWMENGLIEAYKLLDNLSFSMGAHKEVVYFTGSTILLYFFELLIAAMVDATDHFKESTPGLIFDFLKWPIHMIKKVSHNRFYTLVVDILGFPFELGLLAVSIVLGGLWEGIRDFFSNIWGTN